ncbi:MAG: hypothetical protein U1C55_09145, partial [Smithellaceae bacterium]|nr:hypothetical protein [Smithellaceae bacterium]
GANSFRDLPPPFGKGGQGRFIIKIRGYLLSVKSPPHPSFLKRGVKTAPPISLSQAPQSIKTLTEGFFYIRQAHNTTKFL